MSPSGRMRKVVGKSSGHPTGRHGPVVAAAAYVSSSSITGRRATVARRV